jgi:RNA polymerase sigma-70 factor (family 1)
LANPLLNNEALLVEQLKKGSKEAFTLLYLHYSPQLFYNLLSLVKDTSTAEELIQEIFTDIWRNHQSLNIEKSFGDYVFTASRNRVYNFFRKLKRTEKVFSRIKEVASSDYLHIEESIFEKENKVLVQQAIQSLPKQRRKAFELCKMEGLSYQEASAEMGISLSTVKDHMANARETIKRYILSKANE